MPSSSADTPAPESEALALDRLPVVAIVGRPNAGKSTLFNRLVRQPRAIVDSQPGVTRDRNIARAVWDDRPFLLIDTGGFEDQDASQLAESVRAQSALAAEEADVVIALLDGREGVNPADRDFVKRLRQLPKPVLFVANKLDTPALEDEATDFFALGIDEVLAISAAHGIGVGEMMERVFALLPASPESTPAAGEGAIRLAIIGRPNVGKSSLLNQIVGYERSIVSAIPGTTRDAIDTPFRHRDHDYVLIDTAGIRRRPRVTEYVERASAVRALRTLERAEVGLLVMDAVEGMTDQDARIAGYGWEAGRALLLVFNKWDAVPRDLKDQKLYIERLRFAYPTLSEIRAVFLSAKSGVGMQKLFPAIEELVEVHRRQVRTSELNTVLQAAAAAHSAPSVRGKQVRFFYATQTGWAPPLITIFTNHPEAVAASYTRYLANEFRRAFSWFGTPLRIRYRARHEDRHAQPGEREGKSKTRPRNTTKTRKRHKR